MLILLLFLTDECLATLHVLFWSVCINFRINGTSAQSVCPDTAVVGVEFIKSTVLMTYFVRRYVVLQYGETRVATRPVLGPLVKISAKNIPIFHYFVINELRRGEG